MAASPFPLLECGMTKHKRRGSARWIKTRKRAFDRDRAANAKCWICGQPIDYSLGISTCDAAWEADHYLSVSHHPELEYDVTNVRASHRSCNRQRKDKAGVDLLGRPSRIW